MKDITGFRYKRLVAIQPTNIRKNGSVVWECKCDCGNIVQVKGSDLTCHRKGSCGCLEKENQQTVGQRINNSKDITNQTFGRLTALYPTEKRSGSSVVWHCKCECGNETDVSAGALGKTIFSCGCLRKELASKKAKENFTINIIGNKYGKLTVIDYADVKDKKGSYWKCKCECGNEIITSRQCLVEGHTFSCGCLSESHGEYLIRMLLEKNNISYIREYKVNVGFESNYPARFDFYVDNKYIIEFEGIQHYKYTGYGNLLETKKRDKIKNQWCFDNSIPIIRIPYWHLDKLCLKDLLLETSSFIVRKPVEVTSD